MKIILKKKKNIGVINKFIFGYYKKICVLEESINFVKTARFCRLISKIGLKISSINVVTEAPQGKELSFFKGSPFKINWINIKDTPDLFSNLHKRFRSKDIIANRGHNIGAEFFCKNEVIFFFSADIHKDYVKVSKRWNTLTFGFTDGTTDVFKYLNYPLVLGDDQVANKLYLLMQVIKNINKLANVGKKKFFKKIPQMVTKKKAAPAPAESTFMAKEDSFIKALKEAIRKNEECFQILFNTLASNKKIFRECTK